MSTLYILHYSILQIFSVRYTVSLSWKQKYWTFCYLIDSALFYPHFNLKNINPSFEYMNFYICDRLALLSPFYEGHREYTFSSMIHITQPLLDHIFLPSATQQTQKSTKDVVCMQSAIRGVSLDSFKMKRHHLPS